jgi:hypothetical protein
VNQSTMVLTPPNIATHHSDDVHPDRGASPASSSEPVTRTY